MKEIYVYKEDGDSFFTLNKKLDEAAIEAGVILSSKKKRALYYECEKNGSVVVKSEPKTPKLLTKTSLTVSDSTIDKLLKKKIESNLSSYEKVILDCIDKVDAIEKMVENCSGDDCDNKKLHESLYKLFYGEER